MKFYMPWFLLTQYCLLLKFQNQFKITRQGVTKHIKTLKAVGLVNIDAQGRERFCNANPKPLEEISQWLEFYEQFWDDKLGNLGNYFDNKT
ncbi:ArsR/SmtB family transcription factor [Gelatiniphilus marinus]|uniref:ArsR/SmtB family transcription factor n=1 Tax=Gelatiniphilus marinus TaxID=1759464 RepID=A0ABW5JQ44_9FLAO